MVPAHSVSRPSLAGFAVICAAVVIATVYTAHAGINVWTSHGPGGANVNVLAVDPPAPGTLYAGTLGAGVFKSTDGTVSRGRPGMPAKEKA